MLFVWLIGLLPPPRSRSTPRHHPHQRHLSHTRTTPHTTSHHTPHYTPHLTPHTLLPIHAMTDRHGDHPPLQPPTEGERHQAAAAQGGDGAGTKGTARTGVQESLQGQQQQQQQQQQQHVFRGPLLGGRTWVQRQGQVPLCLLHAPPGRGAQFGNYAPRHLPGKKQPINTFIMPF